MNPTTEQLEAIAYLQDVEREANRANQARLHRAAVERRKKAKRGGKR